MRPTPLPLRHEVAFLDEFLQPQLHGAGFAFRELHDLAEGEGFVIGEEGDDLFGERVEVFGAGVFDGDLLGERVLLLHEGAEEEDEPGFPVGLFRVERGLGAAEGAVVAFLRGLDDAFQGAVGHVDVTGTQEHERGEHAGEAAIAILKRTDGEEDDDEAANEQQRVQGSLAVGLGEPGDE